MRSGFYFANSQSAILSMLVPLAPCPALRSGNIRRWLPIAVVGFAELFCFATRLAYMSLFVTAIGMVITLALTKRGSAKVCAVLPLCAAVCAAGCHTVSPMHRNQQAVAANAVRKQGNIGTGWSRRASGGPRRSGVCLPHLRL
ncbi:MAG: O-antigen ligase family protein [Oscillospiraceae bacterium]